MVCFESLTLWLPAMLTARATSSFRATFTCVGVLWRTKNITIVAILIQWDANKWTGILKFSQMCPFALGSIVLRCMQKLQVHVIDLLRAAKRRVSRRAPARDLAIKISRARLLTCPLRCTSSNTDIYNIDRIYARSDWSKTYVLSENKT